MSIGTTIANIVRLITGWSKSIREYFEKRKLKKEVNNITRAAVALAGSIKGDFKSEQLKIEKEFRTNKNMDVLTIRTIMAAEIALALYDLGLAKHTEPEIKKIFARYLGHHEIRDVMKYKNSPLDLQQLRDSSKERLSRNIRIYLQSKELFA